MKLSVIVPVYNAADYLRDCIGSLIAQTLDDYEIILVNDGSTDNSAQIIDEYSSAHPELIRVITLENGGQGRARNFGLEIAKGDYVGFVDSDDWVLPEMYAKLCALADAEEADVAICDIRQINADGSAVCVSTWREDRPIASAGSCCDKIFRRSRIGTIRFPQSVWYEDLAFSAKLLMLSRRTVHVPEMLYMYRCGQPSTMHNNNASKNLDMLIVMEELRRFVDGGGGRREDFLFMLVNHLLLDSVSRLALQDAPDRKEVTRRLRAYARENLPRLGSCESFRAESAKRRLVIWMNYMGLEDAAQLLLSAKNRITR